MARQPRVDFPGAFHHVMHRGARRAPIFAKREDCLLLLDTIGDAVQRFDVEVHGFSLMPNHYHLLLRSVHGDLSRFMQFVDGRYTQRLNRRHRWDGPVFRGRFRSQLVRRPRHLRALLPYLHLNPVRAGLVKRPEDECWTSHRAYLGLETAPEWLTRRHFLQLLGGRSGLRELVTGFHRGRVQWPAELDLDSGYFTDEDEVGAADAQPRVTARRGREASSDRPTADAVLERVRAITQSPAKRLQAAKRGPRANPARRFAAWALVRHAGLSHREAGARIGMTPTAVSKVLWRMSRAKVPEPIRQWMAAWTGDRIAAPTDEGEAAES